MSRVVKSEVVPLLNKNYAMKIYGSSGGVSPRILNFGTKWMLVFNFTFQPLHLTWKESSVSIGREA
jgi:hypothetical protein